MTDENNTEEEPSIEEILSSIRDIISDEDEDGESAPTEQAADDDTPEVVEEAPAPVVEEPEAVEDIAPVIEDEQSKEDGDDVLDLSDFEQETDDVAEEKPADDSDDPLAGINLDHPEDDLDVFDAISEEPADDGVADILEESAEDITADDEFAPNAEEVEPVAVPEDIVMDEPAVEESMDDALIDSVAEVATVGGNGKAR